MNAKQIPQLVHALSAQPLVIERRTLEALVDLFRRKIAGGEFLGSDVHAELGLGVPSRPQVVTAETPMTIQTLIFPKTHWDSAEACKKWARDHDFRDDKVDETETSWRLRQRDPGDFAEGTFRTICLEGSKDPGAAECRVKAVAGHLATSALATRGPGGSRGAPHEEVRIAIIPIQGLISQHSQSLGTSTDEIHQGLDQALANPQIDAILFDVDSPGGTVGGVPELGAKLLAARQQKPTVAFANGLMASAAYWLGAVADEVVVTPSGLVGSIGVYMLHEDWSKHLASEGVTVTAISAGKYKTEGAPWEPLSMEGEAHIRQLVEEVYEWFIKAVAEGRRDTQGNVRAGYGEGRVLGATEALRAHLVDRIDTLDGTLVRLAARVARAARRGPSADLLRKRLALRDVP